MPDYTCNNINNNVIVSDDVNEVNDLPPFVSHENEVTSPRDGEMDANDVPNDTCNDNIGNVIDNEISSNDKETLDDEANVESNVACKKISTTNRRKVPVRFCQKMKAHEEKGLVKLDPIVFDKNINKSFKH